MISESFDNSTKTSYIATTIVDPILRTSDLLRETIGITLLTVGTLGHLLCIIVILSSKSLRVQSFSVYAVFLSFAGILTLYTGLLRNVMQAYSGWTFDPRDSSELSCKVHSTLTYLSLQVFAWLQATIAVDRVIAVLFPHRYKSVNTWTRGLAVVAVELLLAIALNSIVFTMVGFEQKGFCSIDNLELSEIWSYIDLISFSLAPAMCIVISNSAIVTQILRNRNQSKKAERKTRSITITLMAVNVWFLITTLPISVVILLDWVDFTFGTQEVQHLIYTCFTLLQYMGTASTFFIYCLTGTKIRSKIKTIISRIVTHFKVCKQFKIAHRNSTTAIGSETDLTGNHNDH